MFKVHSVHSVPHSTDREMVDDDDKGDAASCEKHSFGMQMQTKFFLKPHIEPNSSIKTYLFLNDHSYEPFWSGYPPNAWFTASTTPTMANLHYLKLHLTFPILLLLLKNLPVAFPRTLPTFLCVQNSKSNSYSGPN